LDTYTFLWNVPSYLVCLFIVWNLQFFGQKHFFYFIFHGCWLSSISYANLMSIIHELFTGWSNRLQGWGKVEMNSLHVKNSWISKMSGNLRRLMLSAKLYLNFQLLQFYCNKLRILFLVSNINFESIFAWKLKLSSLPSSGMRSCSKWDSSKWDSSKWDSSGDPGLGTSLFS